MLKKLAIVFALTIVAIIILPQMNVSRADMAGGGGVSASTIGLTEEMQTYVERYIRAYLQEAHKQNPNPLQYNAGKPGSSGAGAIPYGKTVLQNELSTSEIGSNGISGKRSCIQQ